MDKPQHRSPLKNSFKVRNAVTRFLYHENVDLPRRFQRPPYLSGTYCHKTGTRPRQPTIYTRHRLHLNKWLLFVRNLNVLSIWMPTTHLVLDLQWGSEYQTSLVFKWSERGWMPNGLVFEHHLNTRQMYAIVPLNIKVFHWIVPQRLLNQPRS